MTIREAFDRVVELAGIKQTGPVLLAETTDLEGEYVSVMAEKHQLLHAPESPAAQHAQLAADVEALAAAKLAVIAAAVQNSLSPALVVAGDNTVTGLSRPTPLAAAVGAVDLGLFCLMMPDVVIARLGRALPDVEDEPAAPPMHERPKRCAALDRQAHDIRTRHAAKVAEAAALGLGIAHLELTAAQLKVDASTATYRQERDARDARANGRSSRLGGR